MRLLTYLLKTFSIHSPISTWTRLDWTGLSWPVTQLQISHAKKTQQDFLVAACFILHVHFNNHFIHFKSSLPWRENRLDLPSCPLSSSDDTTAMDKNHQFVWVGKGIMTHEDEGKRLFGFEVILWGRQTDINEVTMACERGPSSVASLTLAESKQQKASNRTLVEK